MSKLSQSKKSFVSLPRTITPICMMDKRILETILSDQQEELELKSSSRCLFLISLDTFFVHKLK